MSIKLEGLNHAHTLYSKKNGLTVMTSVMRQVIKSVTIVISSY